MTDVDMKSAKLAKSLLRKNITDIMNNMSTTDCIRQSEFVQQKLMIMKEWTEAKRISIYLSMEKELQTDALVESALKSGKECFIPICSKDNMRMLKLKDLEDFHNLPKNSWGIREPKPTVGRDDLMETGGVDLVVVPGVAFTKDGLRLGHGRGYYDRFLNSLNNLYKESPAKTIALAFHQQIVHDVPVTAYDVKIDQILYPPKEHNM